MQSHRFLPSPNCTILPLPVTFIRKFLLCIESRVTTSECHLSSFQALLWVKPAHPREVVAPVLVVGATLALAATRLGAAGAAVAVMGK